MLDLSFLPLWGVALTFAAAALAIALAGTRLAGLSDHLADRTGLGEIIAGALFVGASTSLPGIITSVATAAQGYPALAIGNAVGGLTAQTTFLAVADLAYRRANLEHAAASVTGLTQGTLFVALLAVPLLAGEAPEVTLLGVHPASIVLPVGYAFGLQLMAQVRDQPMWRPVHTHHTQDEAAQAETMGADRRSTAALWVVFALFASITAIAGYAIAEVATELAERTPLSEAAIGTVFTAIATSLPELVTTLAAIRRGALNLAVGGIIGGNTFDLLFIAAADVAWREGSIYHAFAPENTFVALVAILMTCILLLGMLRRERHGIAGIGFESALVLLLYLASLAVLFA